MGQPFTSDYQPAVVAQPGIGPFHLWRYPPGQLSGPAEAFGPDAGEYRA
jgi:hypothetical protein